jgi:hypothetical protein
VAAGPQVVAGVLRGPVPLVCLLNVAQLLLFLAGAAGRMIAGFLLEVVLVVALAHHQLAV